MTKHNHLNRMRNVIGKPERKRTYIASPKYLFSRTTQSCQIYSKVIQDRYIYILYSENNTIINNSSQNSLPKS